MGIPVGNPLVYWQKWAFIVEIDDIKVGGFTTCSSIKQTFGVVRQEEGGALTSVDISNSKFKSEKLTLTRGASNNTELANWAANIKAGNQDRRNISIIKQDGAGNPLERRNIDMAVMSDYEEGDFDGKNETDNAIETVSFEWRDVVRKAVA